MFNADALELQMRKSTDPPLPPSEIGLLMDVSRESLKSVMSPQLSQLIEETEVKAIILYLVWYSLFLFSPAQLHCQGSGNVSVSS